MERTKEWRLSQKKKYRNKALKMLNISYWYFDGSETRDQKILKSKEKAVYFEKNRAKCSCWMCGNVKEMKNKYKLKEEGE